MTHNMKFQILVTV